MKVICIDASLTPNEFPYENNFRLVEGNIYTVIDERKGFDKFYHVVYGLYKLLEDEKFLWSKDKFIPLSEIDETEMELINNKELQNNCEV